MALSPGVAAPRRAAREEDENSKNANDFAICGGG
jgi:hypothetical protein